MQPQTAKQQFKVIIVKGSTSEFEKLLNEGWLMGTVAGHPSGAMVVLVK